MRRHAKASSAGSTQRQGSRLGRILCGADATRAASLTVEGSGAPSRSRLSLLACAALALCALVALTASVASGAVATEYVKSFGPDGTEASDFETVYGIGVDQQTGAVYVFDGEAGVLHKFNASGQPLDFTGTAPYISGNEISGLDNPLVPSDSYVPNETQVAVDSTSHVVYVTNRQSIRAFAADGEPAQFTAGPGEGTSEIPGFAKLSGVAVDANGAIYASDEEAGTVSVFAATGAPLTSFSISRPGNLAVAPDGTVYVAVDSSSGEVGVHKFIPGEFPVSAATTHTAGPKLQPAQALARPHGVAVDPLTGDIYVLESFSRTWVTKYESDGTFERVFGKAGEEGELKGFVHGIAIVGGGEEFQFYVGTTAFLVDPEHFSKVAIFGERINPGPPSIRSTSAVDVSSTSATLRAEVNPNTFATAYRFEYGLDDCSLSACTSVPVSGASVGSGHRFVAVSRDVAGLQPGTTYHYRVVAENSEGITEGTGRTFTTQLSGLGFQLTDRRAWEMVSPPDKHGGRLVGAGEYAVIQAGESGNELVYPSLGSIEVSPDGNRIAEPSEVLARRGADAWRSKDITPPNNRVTPLVVGHGPEYRVFSADLDTAVVEPRSGTPLSPQASERTPYLRENTEPASYTPLVTSKEGFANVPPGTEFGGGSLPFSHVGVKAATADLEHLGLVSQVPLVADAPPGALYEWSGGQVHPVSVLPSAEGGAMVTAAPFGSAEGSVRNAISEDGSRIFWGTGAYTFTSGNNLTALYMRDTQAEETVRLDVPQPGASEAGEARPAFQGANPEGTVIFFKDSRQLTADASPSGWDLYRCEIPLGAGLSGCATLTNISAPLAGSGESAETMGVLSGISEDAATAYFVAKGVLDPAPNEAGDSAVSGEPNLYVWRQGSGLRFIATLSDKDQMDWGGAKGVTRDLRASASPNGRYLSFMSERSLTGYDNTDATTGKPVQEVFSYDAVTDRLGCVSCNPTGASPRGQVAVDSGGDRSSLVDPFSRLAGRALAAALPEPIVLGVHGNALYRPRAMLDNGRVFFNAFDSLVPADSNGEWDVYQYEPTGVGDCSASSGGTAVSRSAGGCVSLLSSGTGEREAGFLDASATGDDVFFLTPARLSVLDEDDELDVYNARVDGVPARLEPSTECLGEACQPAAIAPNDPTPASAGLRGKGNLVLRPNCGTISRRVGKLSRRAKALRRTARRVNSPKAAKQLRGKARRHARKARGLSKRAKRCRRANRRAAR